MTKPVPRSRLNITYRTKIEGTPKKVKLPMRFLVLGDFTGGNTTPLGEREVHSILPGMQLGSFMSEINVTSPIDHPDLSQTLTGRLTGHIQGTFKKEPAADAKEADVLITGKGVVRGARKLSDKEEADGTSLANGLGDFEGEVVIRGELRKVALDGGLPKLDTADLRVTGKVRGDITQGGISGTVMGRKGGKLDIEGTVTVKLATPKVSGDSFDLQYVVDSDVTADVPVSLTIPLYDPSHFKPVHIAASVPEVRRLVTLRRVLLELRGYISGQPELREAFKAVLPARPAKDGDPVDLGELGKLQAYLKASYPQLLLNPADAASAADAPAQ